MVNAAVALPPTRSEHRQRATGMPALPGRKLTGSENSARDEERLSISKAATKMWRPRNHRNVQARTAVAAASLTARNNIVDYVSESGRRFDGTVNAQGQLLMKGIEQAKCRRQVVPDECYGCGG